jgi:hypothetical protein
MCHVPLLLAIVILGAAVARAQWMPRYSLSGPAVRVPGTLNHLITRGFFAPPTNPLVVDLRGASATTICEATAVGENTVADCQQLLAAIGNGNLSSRSFLSVLSVSSDD